MARGTLYFRGNADVRIAVEMYFIARLCIVSVITRYVGSVLDSNHFDSLLNLVPRQVSVSVTFNTCAE